MDRYWATKAEGGADVEPPDYSSCLELFLTHGGSHVWYRGQQLFDWPLSCSLERALMAQAENVGTFAVDLLSAPVADQRVDDWIAGTERALLHRFQDLAEEFEIPDLPPSWDRLAWWELMQHHGAPTRLLDWTTSPFVALWFALEHHQEADGDAAVWVLDVGNYEVNMAAAVKKVNEALDPDAIDGREWQNRLVNAAIELAGPVPVPVTPRRGLHRAAAQQGVLSAVANLLKGRPNLTTRVRIKKEWRPEIWRVCESMGLSRLRLYRDLDTLGSTLKRAVRRRQDFRRL
jgi:hypothetical protein